MRRGEIEGLQEVRNRYSDWTRIFLKGNRGAFKVSRAFKGNENVQEWLKGLPDIDERNAARIERMIDTQAGSGVGTPRHDDLLRKADSWRFGLSVAAGAGWAAALVPYHPIYAAGVVALLVLPPLAAFLVHRYPLLFTMMKAKVDPRADLSLLIVLPGIGMLMWLVENDPSHLFDPSPLLLGFGLTMVAFFASIATVIWKSPARWAGLFMLTIFGTGYSAGLVKAADTMPDDSVPSFFRTWVVTKFKHRGSRSTTLYLRLAPWGPIKYADDVSVPASTYNATAVGLPACVASHRGFLKAAWYELVSCAGPLMRDATLSVPETELEARDVLADAQRDAARRPRDAHAQFVLGECLLKLQRYDEALPPLLAAEQLDSTDAWDRSVIGWVLNQQGRFAEAVPHLRAAVALDSTYGEAQHNLAWSYLKLTDLPDAERTYDIVVRLKPTSAEAAIEYAWVLERLHGARAAEHETVRALQLDPKNGKLQAYAGYVFRSEAKFADARQHYEAASRLLPDDAGVWAELAATDYLLDDRVAAAAAFAESVRLDGNYVRSRPGLVRMWRDVAPGKAS